MKSDIIRIIIKRRTNFFFVISIACIVLGLIISMLLTNGIHDWIFGPFEKDIDELLTLPESRWDYYLLRETWITVQAEELYPISTFYNGFDENDVPTYAIVAQLDDYLLIIQAECVCTLDSLSLPNITGIVGRGDVVYRGDFYAEVRAKFRRRYPDIESEFLPIILDLDKHPIELASIGFLFGISFISAGIVFFIEKFHLSRNPTHSYVVRRFKNYGNPQDILEQIEYEMKYMRIGKKDVDSNAHCLTQNWLLYAPPKQNDFFAMRYEDIIWVRQMMLDTLVYDRYGQTISILGMGSQFKHILDHKTPWAFHENTIQLRLNWENRPKEFIEEVDKRRLDYEKPKKRK